jgi:LEA14-like dessication related protein
MKKAGILVALGVAAWLVYNTIANKKRAISYLTYNVQSVKLVNVNLLSTQLEITVSITNPSSENFAFERFFGKVSVNGTMLTSFLHDSINSGIVIKGNASTQITFPVNVQNFALLNELVSTIKNMDTGNIQIDGTIDIAGISLPLSTTFRLNLSNITGGVLKGVSGIGSVLN